MEEVTTSFDEFVLLDGSVPDLAATLTTQAEQDAEDTNLSFLRRELVDAGEDGWETVPEGQSTIDTTPGDWDRPQSAAQLPVGGRRYTPAELQNLDEQDGSHFNQRHQSQEYRGWAPGTSEDDRPHFESSLSHQRLSDDQLLRRESQDLRERMRNRLRRDYLDARVGDRSHRGADLRQPPIEESGSVAESGLGRHSPAPESSLRTTALLQAVRRNGQLSQHTPNQLQRFILDRERTGGEGDESREMPTESRSNSDGNISPSQRQAQIQYREARVRQEFRLQQELLSEHHRRLERLAEEGWRNRGTLPELSGSESRRRRHWHVPTSRPNPDTRSVDGTIKYLGRLRYCESDLEGRETAEDVGFEQVERNLPEFLTNTRRIPPPPMSSWLQMGGMLFGSQSAITPPQTSSAASIQHDDNNALSSSLRSRIRHPTFGSTIARTTSPVRSTHSPVPVIHPPAPDARQATLANHVRNNDENWPVKVTLQSVDYTAMSLCGTMEAFNVPDKSSPTRESSISTYLEGEIIDFNRHTLETKSFKADPRIDATYWFRLPPFRDMKDEEEMIRCLTNECWLAEELMGKWILMRWKGSLLFMHPFASFSAPVVFSCIRALTGDFTNRKVLCHSFRCPIISYHQRLLLCLASSL